MKKIAIITGASSGMGLEFTKELFYNYKKYNFSRKSNSKNNSSENEKKIDKLDEIWILARRYNKLEDLKYSLEKSVENEKESYPQIKAIEIDLSGKSGINTFKALLDAQKKFESIEGKFEISLLINNAGFGTYGEFTSTPLDREIQMIDLNCTSLTGICSIVIPFMNQGSTIINVSSLAAFLPLGNFAVYAATKSYVLSFSVALAAEVKDKGIHVMAMCPGSVSTEFANVASNGARKEVLHGKSANKTVVHGLKSAARRKYIALWAPKWKFTAFFSRFIGRFLGARYTYLYNKRPSAF